MRKVLYFQSHLCFLRVERPQGLEFENVVEATPLKVAPGQGYSVERKTTE